MKKISIVISLFLISLSVLTAQNLRSSVALVKPQLTSQAKDAFLKIAADFKTQGYDDLSDYFEGWAGGGHGSGVLIETDGGKKYLITNRHVASFCDTAEVSFHNLDGTQTVWSDCPVLYLDPDVDVAIIGIPSGEKMNSLKFQTTVTEGTEVWSAGYPGLANRAEWQLAKGNITNASVVMPELGKEKDAVFYQHSASIDPGNSGGPLVVGDPTKPETVRVLGINTWSARGRNNSFYAVPASKINDAIKKYQALSQNSIYDAVQNFSLFLNAETWDQFAFRHVISYHFSTKSGWDFFEKAARTMSSKDRELWYNRFFSSPIDTLSQYLSFYIWQKAHEAGKFVLKSTDTDPSNQSISHFTSGDMLINATWVNETGQWKVLDCTFNGTAVTQLKDSKLKQTDPQSNSTNGGISVAAPCGGSFHFSLSPPLGDNWSNALGLNFFLQGETKVTQTGTFLFRFGFSQDSTSKSDYSKEPVVKKFNLLETGIGYNHYFPMIDSKGYWAPFIGASANLGVALPVWQEGFFAMFGKGPNNNADAGADLFASGSFLAFIVEPKAGIEFSFDKTWAFGVDAGLRWYLLGRPGLKSVPIGIYIKSVSLY